MIIAISCEFPADQIAQQRAANQAETNDAHGALNVLRFHTDNSDTFSATLTEYEQSQQ